MSPVEFSGYRGLWSAVILQAFVDLRLHTFKQDIPQIKETGNLFKDKRRMRIALINRASIKKEWATARKNAMDWIFSNESYPTSFIWICDCLDYDPELLRSMAGSCEGIERVLRNKGKLK